VGRIQTALTRPVRGAARLLTGVARGAAAARKLRAKALAAAGLAAVTAGAWDAAGRARGLVVGGALAVVFALLFVDVDAR
jgi:hypothetical protein